MNKLLKLFGYKLSKLPVVEVSEPLAVFAFEMDGEKDGPTATVAGRYELFTAIRERVGKLEDAVYADKYDPLTVRYHAASLGILAMRAALMYGELLPLEGELEGEE